MTEDDIRAIIRDEIIKKLRISVATVVNYEGALKVKLLLLNDGHGIWNATEIDSAIITKSELRDLVAD